MPPRDVASLVARWHRRRTYAVGGYPAEALCDLKGGQRVSVVLPALNEAGTVGQIICRIRRELVQRVPLVDELVVVDSGSTDATAAVAGQAGARVVAAADVLVESGARPGKGEALWKSLAATEGDLVVFIDADLHNFSPTFVTGLLGPLLTDADIDFVKACYERPLRGISASGGGRVTELVARPLLNLHWPLLSGFVQPLAGEYAARREVLEQVPFVTGYGVELAMLIDLLDLLGLDRLAQVDLGRRVHEHQPDTALGVMAAELYQVVAARLGHAVSATALTQFHRPHGGPWELHTRQVTLSQRPAIASVPAYRERTPRPVPVSR